MSDQSSHQPSDQPSDHQSSGSSGRPPIGETIRAKMDELEVERHLSELAGTLEHAVRQGVAKAGDLAHEHRGDIERLIDKAATAVDRRTDGRHADKISQVRGSLERGVERIADQRPGTPPDEPGPDVPPSPPSDG
ncbi:MAG TPA: antitoxin [Nocardioides sp.]|uniref:antitoxin n=1 Tax=Nocardioides sp. TaxID=35761 RepID=UPI002F41EC87